MELIVTADDYGYCNERDLGILKSCIDGIVTNISILITKSIFFLK